MIDCSFVPKLLALLITKVVALNLIPSTVGTWRNPICVGDYLVQIAFQSECYEKYHKIIHIHNNVM